MSASAKASDVEDAIVLSGHNLSTLEGEFNRRSFNIVGYVDGSDLNLDPTEGILALEWVEPEPPSIMGVVSRKEPIFLAGKCNDPDLASIDADFVAVLEKVNVEQVTLGDLLQSEPSKEIEGVDKQAKVWKVQATYSWSADLSW